MRALILCLGGLLLLAGLLAIAGGWLARAPVAGVSQGQGLSLATAGMSLMILSRTIRGR